MLSWLLRLEDLFRDTAIDDHAWHQNVIRALPYAIVAFLLGWIFHAKIGPNTPINAVGYPLLFFGLLILEALLLLRPKAVTIGTFCILLASGLFFVTKMFYVLFLAPASVNVLGEFTQTFFWLQALNILSSQVARAGLARRLTQVIFAAIFVMTVVYTFLPGQENHGAVLFALAQLLLSSMTLYTLTLRTSDHERQRTLRMKKMALTDALTGLVNRLGLEHELEMTLEEAHRRQQAFALLFLDLDGFKKVNDTLGHEVGDLLLREVAQRLTLVHREEDVLARLGGDEFVILVRGATPEMAGEMTTRVEDVFKTPLASSQGLPVSASVGYASYPDDGGDKTSLMASADSRMYEIKRHRKQQRVNTEAVKTGTHLDIKQALETDQILLRPSGQSFGGHGADSGRGVLELAWQGDASMNSETLVQTALSAGQQRQLWERAVHLLAHLIGTAGAPAVLNVPGTLFHPRMTEYLQQVFARHQVSPTHLTLQFSERILDGSALTLREMADLMLAGVHLDLTEIGHHPQGEQAARTLADIYTSHRKGVERRREAQNV